MSRAASSILPPLDPQVIHAAKWNHAFTERVTADPNATPLAIALERPDGTVSRFDYKLLSGEANARENYRYVERIVKFLLWSRGASRVVIGGANDIAERLRHTYSATGDRRFDFDFFSKLYRQPLAIDACAFEAAPAPREIAIPLGRHLDGCRIGFDLGGSDRKCAAVIDGKVVFSEEIAWDPYFQSDPQYHYDGINDTLKRAAAHLPRVDAIGGSAAGVYVNNEVRAASLFRGVSPQDFDSRIRRIFSDLQKEWAGIPFEVANDGEVTALAASMSFGENRVLGISMGTSVASGYVTADGGITSWLNELAFAPIDYREPPRSPESHPSHPSHPADPSESTAPLDEWSGDAGCAVQFFCQQGVARLAPLAGLDFPAEMKLPERLIEVQQLMAAGDPRARQIYETIGICFGYAIAHYAEFYDIGTLLILGRVTSGAGGDLLLGKAGEVLRAEFPALAGQIKLRVPDEKDKRHGQAVAAASLPSLQK